MFLRKKKRPLTNFRRLFGPLRRLLANVKRLLMIVRSLSLNYLFKYF